MNTRPEKPQSSIIIPVHNNLLYTKSCLECIFTNTDLSNTEIIVVDNASTDGTGEYLNQMELPCPLRIIYNSSNLGFARACNQGARASRGKFLVFLNNDTEVKAGWLEALLCCASSSESGAVASKLLYPDGSIQHAGVVFTERMTIRHIYSGLHKDHPAVNRLRPFQAVTAACMLISKIVFFKAGQFDERYKNGFEDVDLCLNLKKMGYINYYCPGSVITHHESKTSGRHDHSTYNALLLSKKWALFARPDEKEYYRADNIEAWTEQGLDNQRYLMMRDFNPNPFLKQARIMADNREIPSALQLYEQALKYNPYDIENKDVAKEMQKVAAHHQKSMRIHKKCPGENTHSGAVDLNSGT